MVFLPSRVPRAACHVRLGVCGQWLPCDPPALAQAPVPQLDRAEDNIKVVTLSGGVPLRGQASSLEHGAHIVAGTPGRVMDHLDRGNLNLDALNSLVRDEADRMLDMGCVDDIAKVARRCPPQRQTLLFSATYPLGTSSTN